MSKETEKEEITINSVQDVPLAEGESIRIIITQYEDGSINSSAKAKGKNAEIDIFKAIGIIDTAKCEIQLSSRKTQPAAGPQEPEVQVTLDHIDAELDNSGQMEKMGVAVGDTVMVLESYAKIRETKRAEFIAHKNSQTEGADKENIK